VVAQQASDAGVVLADVDMAALLRWRSQLPALGHRLL
jgi:predicted amidohydrolase